ncbi:hypothetical protein WN944_015215 [Citrus x changshan-huyou]|uniref:Reverse transcriptase domain-containing protein n=1 Tax=Citrus x changshan-huyou TaxID=2935761 RepID=A0AAP0MC26_9ROSI
MSGSIKENVDTANMEHALIEADAVKDEMSEDEESMVEEMPEEHLEQPHGQEQRLNLLDELSSLLFIVTSGNNRIFGGIWLLWRDRFDVEIVFNHKQFIHLKILSNNVLISWVTTVYASPIPIIHRELWDHLNHLAAITNEPWIVGRDFNSIRFPGEKMGFKGPIFTRSHGSLSKRLDRVVCNKTWFSQYPNVSVLHLLKVKSDHRHVLAVSEFTQQVQKWNKDNFGNIFQRKKGLLARIGGVQRALERRLLRSLYRLEAKLKRELEEVIKDVFRSQYIPAEINRTLLVLIPKTEHLISFKMYRPISLCTVAYKTITKIITNRLQEILPDLIGPPQTSFVPGRHITENIIVAQEIIHSMRRKKGRKGFMAIKVDIEKAYGRLSWNFIHKTLQELNLPIGLINLIMACITTARMNVF